MQIWSKEQAWNSGADELYTPIADRGKFTLRRNWFHNRNCCTFSTFLAPKFTPDKPWNILTIGVFEGASEIWLMQNIMKHPKSKLVCIDPWMKTGKLDQPFMEECFRNAKSNLSQWEDQITLHRGFSQDIMAEALETGDLSGVETGGWDLIIIDGDHNKDPVYVDALHAYRMAKPGGWLLFDDVRNRVPKPEHVKHGLEKFFTKHPGWFKREWVHRYCDCYSTVPQ